MQCRGPGIEILSHIELIAHHFEHIGVGVEAVISCNLELLDTSQKKYLKPRY